MTLQENIIVKTCIRRHKYTPSEWFLSKYHSAIFQQLECRLSLKICMQRKISSHCQVQSHECECNFAEIK